jgi:hypothetical protein
LGHGILGAQFKNFELPMQVLENIKDNRITFHITYNDVVYLLFSKGHVISEIQALGRLKPW